MEDLADCDKPHVDESAEKQEDSKVEEQEDHGKYEMTLYYDEEMAKHNGTHVDNHEEIQIRCKVVYDELCNQKIVDSPLVKRNQFGMISIEDLQQVHTPGLIQMILGCERYDEDQISHMFGSENAENKWTPRCARLAAGASLEGMKDVVTALEPVKSSFCVIRPPGHHALSFDSYGYCFFNNAAIAAHFARKWYGLKRVCIVDWDVHHGDGTQDIFYDTNEVLYLSVHRYENQNFFPYKQASNYDYVGEKDGEGFNVNVPWNTTEYEDDESEVSGKEYKYLFENLLFGIIKEYDPQLIIISAGFDSAKGDILGQQQVEHETYHWLSENLQRICPKILMLLEGGYSMDGLAKCAAISVRALMGYNSDFIFGSITAKDVIPEALECMKNTAKAHSKYWKSAREFLEKLELEGF